MRKFIETKDRDGETVVCFLTDGREIGCAYLRADSSNWLDEWLPNWREIEAELRREDAPEPTPAPTSRADDVALVAQIAATMYPAVGATYRSLPVAVRTARELIREAERQIGGER